MQRKFMQLFENAGSSLVLRRIRVRENDWIALVLYIYYMDLNLIYQKYYALLQLKHNKPCRNFDKKIPR
jgi:hypothetical protein